MIDWMVEYKGKRFCGFMDWVLIILGGIVFIDCVASGSLGWLSVVVLGRIKGFYGFWFK